MTSPFAVVLGDLATDVVAHLSGPVNVGSDTAARIHLTGGGSAANVAAWLASAGVAVAFVGRVGDDEAGELRAEELVSFGVRAHITIDEERPTATVVVIVTDDGQRTMLPDRGANLGLEIADIPTRLFTAGRHLHVSGYTLFETGPRAAALEALRQAREAGMTTSVDPSSAGPLQQVGAEQFLEWTTGVSLCLPNADEARILAGTDDMEAAARRLAEHYDEVVVTLGADGSLWSDGRTVVRSPAADGIAVRDTTGAGDAFTAGYLRALLVSDEVAERLAAGTRLAAQAVSQAGGRPTG